MLWSYLFFLAVEEMWDTVICRIQDGCIEANPLLAFKILENLNLYRSVPTLGFSRGLPAVLCACRLALGPGKHPRQWMNSHYICLHCISICSRREHLSRQGTGGRIPVLLIQLWPRLLPFFPDGQGSNSQAVGRRSRSPLCKLLPGAHLDSGFSKPHFLHH